VLNMVELKLKPSEYFQCIIWITTSSMFDHDAPDYCVAKVGAERALFAIDYSYEASSVATEFLAKAKAVRSENDQVHHSGPLGHLGA